MSQQPNDRRGRFPRAEQTTEKRPVSRNDHGQAQVPVGMEVSDRPARQCTDRRADVGEAARRRQRETEIDVGRRIKERAKPFGLGGHRVMVRAWCDRPGQGLTSYKFEVRRQKLEDIEWLSPSLPVLRLP